MLTFVEPPATEQSQGLPKYSEKTLGQFLLNYDRLVKEDTETPESKARFQAMVQMCRRHRGSTPSDLFGFWRDGQWADTPRFSMLHGTNVFQALVRGAEAGYSQAEIRLEISAKANNFRNRAAEKIARSIYEVLRVEQWDELATQSLFYSSILKLNGFCVSRFNKAKGMPLPMPQYEQMQYQQGSMSVCPMCYYAEETVEPMMCPECGEGEMMPVAGGEMVQDYGVSGFGEVMSGHSEMVIVDGFDMSVDDRRGVPADIESAGWVQWRYPVQRGQLLKIWPHLKLEKKPEWSYPMRLKTALRRHENGEAMPKTDFDRNTYECKQTWLAREEYEDFISPADFQLGDFQVMQGQALVEVAPDGLVFGVVNNELAFVDAENKDRRVKSCLWLADPTSFYGLGARAGLPIQRKINQLDNMAMEGEARSLKGSVVYVPEAVDGAHLEGANTNIPLRPDFATGGNPLKNFLMPLDVSGLSQASLAFLGTQVDTMQRVMGIPDVSLGEGDPYVQTASGQQLVNQRASSLLIPAKKSEGRLKAGWLRDQLDIIQQFYSPEALRQFGSRYGDEWLEDEIQAFFEANLDEALVIAVVPGSEVPETRQEKQMKLRGDIAAGFVPLTPMIQAKLAQQSGYDGLDVNYYESNHKLAQRRFDFVREQIMSDPQAEAAYDAYEQALMDPATGMRKLDEFGNPILNPVIGMLLTAPIMQVNRYAEDHEQHALFWAEKVRQALASGAESSLLVGLGDAMIVRHKQSAFATATQNNTLAVMAQATPQLATQAVTNQLFPPPAEEKPTSAKS